MLANTKLYLSGAIAEYISTSNQTYVKGNDLERSIQRTRTRLKRLISANSGQYYDRGQKRFFMPLFLTLTFRENITDVNYCNYIFTKFIKRLNRSIYKENKAILKYVSVIEFQKRGAVHYHVILFNVPFIQDLQGKIDKAWGQGFIFVNSVRDVKNVGAYVVKYMSKIHIDTRLYRQKKYFASKNLLKPILIRDIYTIMDYMEIFYSCDVITKFVSDTLEYGRFYLGDNSLRYLNVKGMDVNISVVDNSKVDLPRYKRLTLFNE